MMTTSHRREGGSDDPVTHGPDDLGPGTDAAQLAGAAPGELLAAVLAEGPAPETGRAGTGSPGAPEGAGPVTDHLARLKALIAECADAAAMRRRMGAAALDRAAATDGRWDAQWRETVAARLPGHHWPERDLMITAVDAHTGEPVVFDRDSGVDLVDAVAASCASGLAYRIGDRSFIDGGFRRNENADLAAGHGRVLVLSPLGGRTLHPPEWGMQLAAQVEELRAGGSRVDVVVPDGDAEHLFGANAMDLRLRPAAARTGYDQGTALAPQLV